MWLKLDWIVTLCEMGFVLMVWCSDGKLWGQQNYCSQTDKLATADFILRFGNMVLQLLKRDADNKMKSEQVDILNTFVHLKKLWEEWADRCDRAQCSNVERALKEASTWSTDVPPHCASAYMYVYIRVFMHSCTWVCVQLKWRFMVFKLAHASCRGLLSDSCIGCCLRVFFIWINWSPVWKMFMTNGAGKSWTAAYLLQFVRSIFSQPQPHEDFTQREKKKKIGVVSTCLSAGWWLQPRTQSGPNRADPAAPSRNRIIILIQTKYSQSHKLH